jgi:DNA-binding transcriptional regulator YiaG
VNPDHLEPVTQATNSRRGKHAIVTRDMAQQILDLYGVGNHRRRGNLTQEAIAARFGISRDTVIQITTGRHWTIHP